MHDWLETPLGKTAQRIVEIAPLFHNIKRPEQVDCEHLSALAYALGVRLDVLLEEVDQ